MPARKKVDTAVRIDQIMREFAEIEVTRAEYAELFDGLDAKEKALNEELEPLMLATGATNIRLYGRLAYTKRNTRVDAKDTHATMVWLQERGLPLGKYTKPDTAKLRKDFAADLEAGNIPGITFTEWPSVVVTEDKKAT